MVEDTGHVLPHYYNWWQAHRPPPFIDRIGQPDEGHCQRAARIVHATPKPGDAERLAGRPADQDIGRGHFPGGHPRR